MERSPPPEMKRLKMEPPTQDTMITPTPSTSSSVSSEFESRFKHWQKEQQLREQQRRQFEQFSRPPEASTSTASVSARPKHFPVNEQASTSGCSSSSSAAAASASANSTTNFLKTFPLLSSSLSLGGPVASSKDNNEDTVKIKDGEFWVYFVYSEESNLLVFEI